MQGQIMLKALEIIEDIACDTGDFLSAFLTFSKKESYRRLRYPPMRHRPNMAESLRGEIKDKQQLYDLLYRLERDGLIRKTEKRKRKFWLITANGKERKRKLAGKVLPPPRYPAAPAPELVIVSFDIPEKERHKRAWLRSVLKNLNFQKLQKSVWIGKVIIPREFIEDLKTMRLFACVEIFAISKHGTIRHIT